jgi:hypothetical protein
MARIARSGVWSDTLGPVIAMRMAAVLSETTMRCLRIYATPDGESHFDEIDIPTTGRPIFPDTAPFELSAHYPASRIRFTRIPAALTCRL